jgi:transposase
MLECIELYEKAQEMYEQNKILISIDQKTGIQALERLFPDKLVKPGYIKKCEHSYKRHGTKNLIAGFVVATGKITGKCYDRNRNIEFRDILSLIYEENKTRDEIHFIADNYGTSTHLNTCLLVAKLCEIKIDLADLKTKQQRVEFLKQKNKKIIFHFLPTHASWLNQIEVWFSILHSKLIKRGNFSSLKDLEKKINNYIEKDWNLNAHPFQWTYKGKVCCA